MNTFVKISEAILDELRAAFTSPSRKDAPYSYHKLLEMTVSYMLCGSNVKAMECLIRAKRVLRGWPDGLGCADCGTCKHCMAKIFDVDDDCLCIQCGFARYGAMTPLLKLTNGEIRLPKTMDPKDRCPLYGERE